MTMAERKTQPGVADLPTKTRTKFAAALHFEDKGETEKAERYLAQAIEHEEKAE